MEKQIIFIKPGSINPKNKEKLTKAGNIVVECIEPAHPVFRKETIDISSEYVFTNCNRCGERIYLLKERLSALKLGKNTFYCSHGHSMAYK